MKKTVYIIHGCPSNMEKAMNPETRTYDKHWIPWIKQELLKERIEVVVPLMPNPWEPDYEAFKKKFDGYKVSRNDILIGHSCGTTFLVRWLGDTKKNISKLILVAPWKIADKSNNRRKAFYEHPIDETIKERIEKIVIFTADNERPDGIKSAGIIHSVLGGKVIKLEGRGHYTLKDMGKEEFPELLEEILK